MFWLVSKLFWMVAQPLFLVAICIACGFLLVVFRFRRSGLSLIGLGLVLMFVSCFTNIGALLLLPLESRHARPDVFPKEAAGIIVLGDGTSNAVSAARQHFELSSAGDRYVEALHLALAHPQMSLYVTGGIGALGGTGDTDAQSIERLFSTFGLTGDRVVYENGSRNTYENAINMAETLSPRAGAPYVLITSAYHMPRSAALFEQAGFSVVAWPVDYMTTGDEGFGISLEAASRNLTRTETAMHEWIGLLVYWATGRIPAIYP